MNTLHADHADDQRDVSACDRVHSLLKNFRLVILMHGAVRADRETNDDVRELHFDWVLRNNKNWLLRGCRFFEKSKVMRMVKWTENSKRFSGNT